MSTVKIYAIRALVIMTTILGSLFLCSNLEESKITSIISLFMILCVCGIIIYKVLHNRSEKEINNILGLTWLENKTGINFTEE